MICCIQNNVYSYDVSNGRLNFYDVDDTQIYQMDLNSLVFYYRTHHLFLQDAYGFQSLPLDTVASLGLTASTLQSAIGSGTGTGNLSTDIQILTSGSATFPANTLHSISVYVATGTADINGETFEAGSIFSVQGDPGQNNLADAFVIDNLTSTPSIIITTTSY